MPDYVSNKTIEKLKYDLVRDNLVSFEILSRAEEISRKKTQNLAQVLIEEGFIEEDVLLGFIQNNLRIPYVNLRDYSLDEGCLHFITAEDAQKYRILPLFRIENVLTVAMADPLDLFVINNLVKCIKCEIEPIICSERLILESVQEYYFSKPGQPKSEPGLIIDWREELNEQAPDIEQAKRIVNSIVSQALLENAFEIVLENSEEGLNVKFKKPGITEDKGIIPLLISSLCVSHIKNLCNLDNSVSEVPQLGKFSYCADIDYVTGVVSTFPAANGERITIKLYNSPKTIAELPVKNEHRKIFLKSIEKPGIILIAGPELSGKSFIAYTILNSLDSGNKNIMTLESIVKYDLPGINQCELNEKVGFNIEKALKFIDFQSPDIVYIEEMFSGKLFEHILNLAKSGKPVITEINAKDSEDLTQLFTFEEINELQKFLNCFILIKNLNDITVFENIKQVFD